MLKYKVPGPKVFYFPCLKKGNWTSALSFSRSMCWFGLRTIIDFGPTATYSCKGRLNETIQKAMLNKQ